MVVAVLLLVPEMVEIDDAVPLRVPVLELELVMEGVPVVETVPDPVALLDAVRVAVPEGDGVGELLEGSLTNTYAARGVKPSYAPPTTPQHP